MVGKINGLFGVKGWLKVFSYTDPRKNILKYSPWLIEINGEWKELIIQEGKEHSKTIIAHIKNIDDRDLACQFLGKIFIYIKNNFLSCLKVSFTGTIGWYESSWIKWL